MWATFWFSNLECVLFHMARWRKLSRFDKRHLEQPETNRQKAPRTCSCFELSIAGPSWHSSYGWQLTASKVAKHITTHGITNSHPHSHIVLPPDHSRFLSQTSANPLHQCANSWEIRVWISADGTIEMLSASAISKLWKILGNWSACDRWLSHIHQLAHGIRKEGMLRISKHLSNNRIQTLDLVLLSSKRIVSLFHQFCRTKILIRLRLILHLNHSFQSLVWLLLDCSVLKELVWESPEVILFIGF